MGLSRLFVEPFCPAFKYRAKRLEYFPANAVLVLLFAPDTKILFSVLPDLSFEILFLYRMLEGEKVMLAHE